jgi:peroxiredoxin
MTSLSKHPFFDSKGKPDGKRMKKTQTETIDSLIGCKVPDFNVKTIDGKTLSLSELKGKVVVINFWFNTCEPCVAEIPALNHLFEDYKNMDVVFIAFSRDYEPAIKKFLEYKDFNYSIVSGGYDIHERYCPGFGWPVNIVIDRKGILRQIFCGGPSGEGGKTQAYNLMYPLINTCLKEY